MKFLIDNQLPLLIRALKSGQRIVEDLSSGYGNALGVRWQAGRAILINHQDTKDTKKRAIISR
jgi:hypothetical protein